ncbi:hypothetical protein ABXZ88_003287 [Vibrio fluvialis]|uniref:hypothetical protein n=1 Tax=Vibrio fluvialis TaxID=676 RepID=UPI0023A94347|nr:hypothetical protein [Vibrio fluvialis]MDE5179098.1 hypothetical protein [Vibrio fluvialis]
MRQISKAKAAQITSLHQKMTNIESEYNGMLDELDASIQKLVAEFNAKHSERLNQFELAYSETAEALRTAVLEQVEEMESYIGERTDAWHSGETGESFVFWSEQWNDFSDHLERGQHQEFEVAIRLEPMEGEALPVFSPKLVEL